MRNFLTLGVLSLVGAAAIVACGDDDPVTPGNTTGGSGGSSTTGGSGGSAQAGNAGSGGGGSVAAPCTTCVELVIPLAGAPVAPALNEQAAFQFNAAATSPPFDFTSGSITWRVQVLSADVNANYFLQPFAQNAPPDGEYANGVYTGQLALTAANFAAGQWRDVTLDLSDYPLPPAAGGDAGVVVGADAGPFVPGLGANAGFNKSVVRGIGLQLGALAANTAAGEVRIFVDSVTFTDVTGAPAGTFAAGVDGLSLNNYQAPVGTAAPIYHP